MAAVAAADVQRALGLRSTMYRGVGGALLTQLCAVGAQHGLGAKQLAAQLDKFMTVHRQGHDVLQPEDVDAFSIDLARSTKLQARADNLFSRVSLDDMADEVVLPDEPAQAQPSQRITPYLAKSSAARRHTPASSGKFKERMQSGAVQAVLNAHVEAAGGEPMDVEGTRCEVQVLGAPLHPGARFMVDRLEDKAAYLERRILALSEEVEAGANDEGAVHPVAVAAQDAAVFVGRICCDTEEGRLNPQSVLLEGSMRHSQGARVRLDLSQSPAYRLFPGQVVAVHGSNPSGHCVVATEVLGGVPLPMPRSSLQSLAAREGARGRTLVVAAGPYTTSEDLEYEPLAALLEYCRGAPPDVLLLAGPFVDADHPLVRGGLLEESFEDVFNSRVIAQLEQFNRSVGWRTRVALLPSAKDVHHHPVFPQPPLDHLPEVDAAHPHLLLPNPATFSCDEIVVGCSSADWLMACTHQEVSHAAAGQADRLAALAAHVVAQRSYFPLFPAPLALPLDASKASALELPCTPDVLVLPSDLAPFAKLLPVARPCVARGGGSGTTAEGNVVCINPGRLTKGTSAGTFAHLHIAPLKDALGVAAGAPAATNAPVPHQVDERCRVEIRRL